MTDKIIWQNFPISNFTGYHKANKGRYTGKIGKWNRHIFEEELNLSDIDMLDYNKFIEIYHYHDIMDEDDNWTFFVKHLNGYYIFFDTDYECEDGYILYSKNIEYIKNNERFKSKVHIPDELNIIL